MNVQDVMGLVLNSYPLLFLGRYLFALNAFFETARKYDEDFYGLLGRPHIFLNATYETLDLFFRCMWFKRYFGRDRRVVARAKALRTSFFLFLVAILVYPLVRGF